MRAIPLVKSFWLGRVFYAMKEFKDLSFQDQQKYGRLAYCFLQELANEIAEQDLDPEEDTFKGSIELFYEASHTFQSSGSKNFDPRLHDFKTVYTGELKFTDLDIPFSYQTETPY